MMAGTPEDSGGAAAAPEAALERISATASPSRAPGEPMAAPRHTMSFKDPDVRRRFSKKLRRKQKEEGSSPSVELPERLRQSDDDDDEPLPSSEGPPMVMDINQSIFGLIAAAGSRVDFNERFDGSSSDEEDSHTPKNKDRRTGLLHQTTFFKSQSKDGTPKHKRKVSGAQRLLKSLPALPKLTSKSKREQSRPFEAAGVAEVAEVAETAEVDDDAADDDSDEVPAFRLGRDRDDNRLEPVMSRMLEAQAEISSRPSFDLDGLARGLDQPGGPDESPDETTLLAKRLMQIFEFDEPEQVIEEYPCWLLQSVLLQGFMYVTAKHICFYAYLPKKAHEVARTGYLFKSGKHNPKYHRYWFRLKGDVLSYYRDSTELYFPHGQIDLSYGISATVTESDKEGLHFTIVTSRRTYHFKADSAPSAKEWVKSLQRVIFRSHNDGDSVKISLPIENVIDVEETQMMEFADTCKVRVIDNDETYAIDEYFFSFFALGREAIDVLKILVDDASARGRTVEHGLKSPARISRRATDVSRGSIPADMLRTTKLPEYVRATLPGVSSPPGITSPGATMETSSRSSLEALRQIGRRSRGGSSNGRDQSPRQSPRQSFSGNRISSRTRFEENTTPQKKGSTDSYIQSSMEDPSLSNLVLSSAGEDPSASQILNGSEVFQSPTMVRPSATDSGVDAAEKTAPPRGRQQSSPAPRSRPHAATTSGIVAPEFDHKYAYARPATPTLQNITKMGTFPLQRVGAFADYLNKTSQRMSTLLATESMGYVEKVSGMWKGGHQHYDQPAGLKPFDDDLEEASDDKVQTLMDRFRAHFALPETERLEATYFGYIVRVLPLYGKIYISNRSFCFRSLLPGTRTKLILPLKDVENVHKEKGFRFGYSGLVVVIKGHEEMFFEFGQAEPRDDCAVKLLRTLEAARYLKESEPEAAAEEEPEGDASAMAERDALQLARLTEHPSREIPLPRQASVVHNAHTLLDGSDGSLVNFKPQHSMRITCLTIGSRGDVQPYIALCQGLLADGHKPRIATHSEFKPWIESYGIEFAQVEGDPAALMRLCIENGTFTWAFLREANSQFRGWLDGLLDSAYTACEGSELLIESPSAMAGIHIAEKLGIPYFRAFTMPWTRTRAYPHAFIMPENKMGGAYNYMTYVMFDNIFWKATAHQVNRWRNKTLGLPNTSLEKMQPNKVPFLYNFSPSVVAPPLDFSDWIRVTGYWFLDEGAKYKPPKELQDFMDKARADGKKIVYVGFGSIIVEDPRKMTQEVIDAVLKADVRCILSKGWSERAAPKAKDKPDKPMTPEPVMPPEIHVIASAPHDWLFKRIDAAAHHGGSGTTGASLRAGIPTIIRPFFGDQFFFASRVEDLGVGVWVKKWGTNCFGRALWEATRNERMIVKARVLGEEIRKEKGVEVAMQCLYRDMEYAKSLIQHKTGKNAQGTEHEEEDEAEESWTFVRGDEPDPDLTTTKLSEGLGQLGLEGNKALGSQVLKPVA